MSNLHVKCVKSHKKKSFTNFPLPSLRFFRGRGHHVTFSLIDRRLSVWGGVFWGGDIGRCCLGVQHVICFLQTYHSQYDRFSWVSQQPAITDLKFLNRVAAMVRGKILSVNPRVLVSDVKKGWMGPCAGNQSSGTNSRYRVALSPSYCPT